MLRFIIFTGEVQFSSGGDRNIQNCHVGPDEKTHATVDRNFEMNFLVNVWHAVLDDQVMAHCICEG